MVAWWRLRRAELSAVKKNFLRYSAFSGKIRAPSTNRLCLSAARHRRSAHGGHMQDAFTGKPTCIQGRVLPSPQECAALQDDHERRLEALARLRAAAEECGLRTDS